MWSEVVGPVCKASPRLLVDLKIGSLHFFERTKLGIYYEIDLILAAKKCKSLSYYFNKFK